MNKKGTVLVAAPVHDLLIEKLSETGYELILRERISQEEAAACLPDCTGLITSTRLKVDRRLIDAAPALKWIGRMGSGMEIIDTEYAKEKGIACFFSPEGNANAVAEHALGLLLALTKKIVKSAVEVVEGKWIREENRGIELEGKTIGIIGYGHTGSAFARKLLGMDMRILVYDKYISPSPPPGILPCSHINTLLEQADILSFHVPLRQDTLHYVDDSFIAAVRNPFILINTSRGNVVDTQALYRGICSGKIIGAGLDVIEGEPLEAMPAERKHLVRELIGMENKIILTPHIAGYTRESLYKMSSRLLEQIIAWN